jgi:hypothetical protein
MLFASGDPLWANQPADPDEQMRRDEEQAFLDGESCYDVYGGAW